MTARKRKAWLWGGSILLSIAGAFVGGALIGNATRAGKPPPAVLGDAAAFSAPTPPSTPPSRIPASVPAVIPPPPPPPVPEAVRARTVPCPNDDLRAEAARCLVLSVPQDWGAGGGAPVEIFFAVLAPTTTAPQSDPVVILRGGPGQAGSDGVATATMTLGEVRKERALILVDQRGTGRSTPSLRCQGIDPWRYWYGTISADDVRRCLDPVRAAGYRLEHFDTRQAAWDLRAIRRALEIERWNIVATSYGAVLAGELLRLDGAAVRGVVFNSPETATSTWLDTDRFANQKRVFQMMAEDCAAQPACVRAFPNLDRIFHRAAAALTAKPLSLTVDDPTTGGKIKKTLGWPAIVGMMGFRLGTGRGAVMVPAFLEYLNRIAAGGPRGDDATLRSILAPEGIWTLFDHLDYGLNLAIGCRENRPLVDAASARASGKAYYPYIVPEAVENDYDVACPLLGLAPAKADFYAPISGEVPALILTGDYDTLVPTSRAETLARALPRARILRFRGIGHDVLNANGCAAVAAATFLGDLGAAPRDCAESAFPPTFATTRLGGR